MVTLSAGDAMRSGVSSIFCDAYLSSLGYPASAQPLPGCKIVRSGVGRTLNLATHIECGSWDSPDDAVQVITDLARKSGARFGKRVLRAVRRRGAGPVWVSHLVAHALNRENSDIARTTGIERMIFTVRIAHGKQVPVEP